MKVTHEEHDDSTVTLGGGRVHAFTMADTPEFFAVLSDSLYSHKALAVVRETMCNVWDAHVFAGKQDTPVEVSLSKTMLTIRDHGPGIADDGMEIFTTFGLSSKVQDMSQTGGLGLGAKAPFAYTPHFTVTSYHDGKCTVYAASKGTTESKGRPELRQMVQLPTTETGMKFEIPLADGDYMQFAALVREVVLFGGMNATLNDERLPTIDNTDAEKLGFFLVANNTHWVNPALVGSRLLLRYGSVVYPIPYGTMKSKAVGRLGSIVGQHSDFGGLFLVLQAEPGTISITPSRESLSMNEVTIKSIEKLADRALDVLERRGPRAYADLIPAEKRTGLFNIRHFTEGLLDQFAQEKVDGSSRADLMLACLAGITRSLQERIEREVLFDRKKASPVFSAELTAALKVSDGRSEAAYRERTTTVQRLLRTLFRAGVKPSRLRFAHRGNARYANDVCYVSGDNNLNRSFGSIRPKVYLSNTQKKVLETTCREQGIFPMIGTSGLVEDVVAKLRSEFKRIGYEVETLVAEKKPKPVKTNLPPSAILANSLGILPSSMGNYVAAVRRFAANQQSEILFLDQATGYIDVRGVPMTSFLRAIAAKTPEGTIAVLDDKTMAEVKKLGLPERLEQVKQRLLELAKSVDTHKRIALHNLRLRSVKGMMVPYFMVRDGAEIARRLLDLNLPDVSDEDAGLIRTLKNCCDGNYGYFEHPLPESELFRLKLMDLINKPKRCPAYYSRKWSEKLIEMVQDMPFLRLLNGGRDARDDDPEIMTLAIKCLFARRADFQKLYAAKEATE